jgi:uncharacterized protein (DUF342 family)
MTNSAEKTVTKKKYLEPTLHFTRKRILVGTEERAEKVTVSELVKKNQPLLSFPEFEKFAKRGFEKSPVRSGKNTHFADDGETLLADIIGYPRVDIMEQVENEEPILLISINPFVKVSSDKMTATLLLHPPISKDFTIRKEPLPELLKEAGILFGIDQTALQNAQNLIDQGYNDFHDIPIAYGQPPESGEDAYLQFAFEIGPIAGQLMEDGTIDFRERRIMIGVTKDELLATKIPAVPGAPGMDVLGRKIEPDGGTELKIIIKQDVRFIEETGEIKATKDGILTVVNGCEIKVCSKQEIHGDIDYNTGNIDSKNCVVVHGAVQPGFKVLTGGDLEIRKEVMSATLASEANIVIKGGITGKKTHIQALGDVDFKFIEQGHIESGGNVIMRKQSYYSDLSAKGAIRCQDLTTIIGGNIVAGGSLTVANVGSPNARPALIAAGVDIDRLNLQRELSQKLVKQQDAIIQWLQRYGCSTRSKKIRKMEALVDETKMKLLKLNLIPGTALYSRVGTLEDTVNNDDAGDGTQTKAIRIDKIFIDLRGTIFSGTQLRIGNCKLLLKKTISKRRLKLNKTMKQIIAIPIR